MPASHDPARRRFLAQAALGAAGAAVLPSLGCAGGPHRDAGVPPPNVVLVMVDDFGFECLGCNGGTSYATPRLDTLAAEGLRFTQCHSQPLCTPSRVQIMTGRYNHRNYTAFGTLDPGEVTFGHVLREAGYATAVSGKWQLAARGKPEPGTLPEDAGFDEHCLWQVEQRGSRYWDPLLRHNGQHRTDVVDRYGPDVTCDFLLDFIERHADGPFFAYYPMSLTHGPFLPTPHSDPRAARDESRARNFADMVAYTDHLMGRIVDHLEALDLRGNTLILFTGDNGTPRAIRSRLGSRVIAGGKGQTTDAGTHVPLIASGPGVTAGGVTDDLVDFSDVLPTLAEAAGAGLPDVRLDGRSFLPRLRGAGGPAREWVFCHYEPKHGKWGRSRFARDRRYKLYDDGRFFDVVADPDEAHPLAAPGSPAAAGARAALAAALRDID